MPSVLDYLTQYQNTLDPSVENWRRDYQGNNAVTGSAQYQLDLLNSLLSGAGLTGDSAADYTYTPDAPVPGKDRYFADYLSSPDGEQIAQSEPRYDAPFDVMKDLIGPAALVFGGGYGLSSLLGGAGAAGGSALANMPQATNLAAELAGTAAIPGMSEAAIGAIPALGGGGGLSALASMAPATSFAAELAGTTAIPGLSEAAVSSLPALNPFNAATSALANMPQATDLKPELTGTAQVEGLTTPNLMDKMPGLVPSVPVGGSTPTVPGAASSIPDWLKENGKWLAPLLGAGMGLLDGDGSSSGGYKDSGYRPTINRGGWSPSAAQAPSVKPNIGLLNMPTTGVENAGLWRFLNR